MIIQRYHDHAQDIKPIESDKYWSLLIDDNLFFNFIKADLYLTARKPNDSIVGKNIGDFFAYIEN